MVRRKAPPGEICYFLAGGEADGSVEETGGHYLHQLGLLGGSGDFKGPGVP